jgi:hypothetical protein
MGTSARRADWPTGWIAGRQFPAEPNFGLLLRWEAALEEFRRFRAVPEDEVERFLGRFSQTIGLALAENPLLEPAPGRPLDRGLGDSGWDRQPTIFPFLLEGLTLEQTQRVHAMLGRDLDSDRVELGQPVTCGVRDGAALTALRICASARLVFEACSYKPGGEDRVLDRACLALDKTAWLAAEVRAGRL